MIKLNRPLFLTTLALLAIAGATVATLRAAEPSGKPSAATTATAPSGAPAVPAPAPAAADSAEEATSRAAPPPPIDESPQFRESADNNITLPVDI